MRLHRNARTCPASRRLLVSRVLEDRWSVLAAAQAAGISERSAAKWMARFRSQGVAGLEDRSLRDSPRRLRSTCRSSSRAPQAAAKRHGQART